MRISILTLFPKMVGTFFDESIIKKAQEKGLVDIEIVDLRDFATDKHKSVDDRPYGGGAGMVLKAEIIHNALQKIKHSKQNSKTILTSAKGKVFNQQKAQELAQLQHLILIAGHYEGVDERILEFIDEEISLGDFVLTGGEIAASAIADAVVRLIPGVLKKEEAPQIESFFRVPLSKVIDAVGEHEVLKNLQKKGKENVQLLEFPHYTRPEEFRGKKVPEVLLGGDHKAIEKWRLKSAFEETFKKRPDLLQ